MHVHPPLIAVVRRPNTTSGDLIIRTGAMTFATKGRRASASETDRGFASSTSLSR